MRNSYLGAVLAKYETLKSKKTPIIVDEFLLQSLFMIFQKKTDKKKIKKVLNKLFQSNKILIIEEEKSIHKKKK